MPGRLYNPPAYVIYDRSYEQSVSTSGSTTIDATSGTPSSIIDKDTTTAYDVHSKILNNNCQVLITIDYGKVLWNTLIYCNYVISSAGGGADSSGFFASADGTNWTTLRNGTTAQVEEDFILMKMRYLRWQAVRSASAGEQNTQVVIYECRVMGG